MEIKIIVEDGLKFGEDQSDAFDAIQAALDFAEIPTYMVVVPPPYTDERANDLLIGAFEGGSNSWIKNVEYSQELVIEFNKLRRQGKGQHPIYGELCNLPGVLTISIDVDEDDEGPYILSLKTFKEGIELMHQKYPNHYENFISENDDAETSDVALQLALFKELVYG